MGSFKDQYWGLCCYINDFSRASELLFSILFADDTSVFIEGTNYDKMIDILNIELKRVDKWLKANKLTINTKKSLYDISSYSNQM